RSKGYAGARRCLLRAFALRRSLSHYQESDRGGALASHRRRIASPRSSGAHSARHVRSRCAMGACARSRRSSVLRGCRAHADQGRRPSPIAAARSPPPRRDRRRAVCPHRALRLYRFGYYRAAERLIDGLLELVLCLRGEIEPAILLGEAFLLEDILLPYPANATHAQ